MRRRGGYLATRLGHAMLAAALCAFSLNPALAAAEPDGALPSAKEETVHVHAGPDGSVRSEEVSVVLKNGQEAPRLLDATSLREVHADDESQMPVADGETLTWSAHGSDIAYTGTSERRAPVGVDVTYKLDGQSISPSEIAGKSGRVEIRYDYRNDASFAWGAQTLYTPFTAITALMLDGMKFKNIAVENGRVLYDGDDAIVMGYAAPGLKESLGDTAADVKIPSYFKVSADAEGFETKSTLTMVSAGLMEGLDLGGVDADQLQDTSTDLAAATSSLVAGADELAGGLSELAGGSAQVSDAAQRLNEGAASASGSLPALVESIKSLDKGAAELSAGATQLSQGTEELAKGIALARQACGLIQSLIASLKGPLDIVKANNGEALSALEKAIGDEGLSDKARGELARALALLQANDEVLAQVSAQDDAQSALQQISSIAQQIEGSLDDEQAASLSKGASAVAKGAASLSSGLSELSSGASPIVSGVNQLVYGASALAEGADELAQSTEAAAKGSGVLADGMHVYRDTAISEIIDMIDRRVLGLVNRLERLKQAAKEYDNFSGKLPQTDSSVRFVIEVDAI